MLLLAILTAASGAFALQTPDFKNPDFDYPQTVIADAAANLKPGLPEDTRFLAMLEIAKAKTDIDPDSMYVLPEFVANQRATCKNEAYNALYDLYEIKVLQSLMDGNRYDRSDVSAPLHPIPSDIRRWNYEQYKFVIDSLETRALAIFDSPTGKLPIGDFSAVITKPNELGRAFFPTLRDFGYAMLIDRSFDNRSLLERIISLSTPGTPSWAYWKCLDGRDLESAYNEYKTGLTGAKILSSLADRRNMTTEKYVAMLREYLDREPENALTPSLQVILDRYTRPTVSSRLPELVAPCLPFDVKISYSYVHNIQIRIYLLKMGTKRSRPFTPASSNSTLVLSRELTPANEIGDTTETLTVDADGTYYIQLIVDNDRKENQGEYFTASTYVPVLATWQNQNSLAVVNAIDGSPLKDATVLVDKKTVGKTNNEGIASFPYQAANYDERKITVRKDDVIYDFGGILNIHDSSYAHNFDSMTANFFIERPIYHPGDTVKWAAVLGKYDNETHRGGLCRDLTVKVVAYDANSTAIDTIETTSDSYGRIEGQFAIPTDRLTGHYYMAIESTSINDLYPRNASGAFMVSDFKAPVFEVKNLITDIADDGSVTISAKALTYSDMPVADAKVDVVMRPYYSWWWRNMYNKQANYSELTYNVSTGSDGAFTITIPADTLTPGANYRIHVKVTSVAAETAEAYLNATLDKAIGISYHGPSLWNTDNGPIMPIYATTSDGKRVSREARWQLINDTKVLASGDCTVSPEGTSINLAKYPAAQYKLYIAPLDTTRCVSDTITITTYSIERNLVPDNMKGFIPQTSVTAKAGQKAKVHVGMSEKAVAYVFIANSETIISSERRMLKRGFNEIETPELKPGEQIRITVAIHDGTGFIRRQATAVGTQPEKVRLSIESWRDNVVPGTPETITLRLKTLDGKPMEGALVATMYNHALDALMPGFSYHINGELFPIYNRLNNIGTNTYPYIRYEYMYYAGKLPRRHSASLIPPALRFLPTAHSYIRFSATMMRTAATGGVNDLSMTEDDGEVVMTEAVAYNAVAAAPAPAPAMKSVSYDTATSESEEEVVEGDDETTEEMTLRQGTIYSAYWNPTLLFNADGSASVTYNVPDGNGTWSFLASAWTQAAFGSTVSTNIVSAKPIMVQPALPRYLRSGDKAKARVTVFNKDDKAGVAKVEITVTSSCHSTFTEQSVEIEAGQSAVIPFEITYPAESSDVVVKVVAKMGDYSDGQQDILPVLGSDLTVIDSKTFYLTDKNPEFKTTLPARGSSTLTYCANPVWDVVKALPALLDRKPITSTGAANSIYGALTARGLSRSFPEIKRAIDIWMASPEDSALVSRLYKNEELKMATLQQTPWQWVAGSETQRMQRLSVTFDSDQIKSTLDGSINILETLQNADGGFNWGPWDRESSFWTTSQVLSSIGRLNAWGYLDSDSRLDKIIERAFVYLDTHTKYHEIAYAYVASLYPNRKPTTQAAVEAIARAAQIAVKEWHQASPDTKAQYALMLDATGYTPVAKEIMKSIAQFEVQSPLAGISFPSVYSIDSYATIMQAFAKIAPSTERLDAMRQWLVLRTQVTDDLGTWSPTSLINAILATGSRWTTLDASMPAITINGNAPTLTDVEKITGTFSLAVDTSVPAEISVNRPAGAGVSYGAVSSVYDQDMREVKPRGSAEISVEKTFLVADGNDWKESDSFTLGQTAKVRLYVTVSRDMEYVTIIDERSAAFEPADQLAGYVRSGSVVFYRENKDSQTRMFINYLPKGTYYITYDVTAATQGTFASGPATIQSQYAPELNARSGSVEITVTSK